MHSVVIYDRMKQTINKYFVTNPKISSQITIGSDTYIGAVLSSNKPLSEWIFSEIFVVITLGYVEVSQAMRMVGGSRWQSAMAGGSGAFIPWIANPTVSVSIVDHTSHACWSRCLSPSFVCLYRRLVRIHQSGSCMLIGHTWAPLIMGDNSRGLLSSLRIVDQTGGPVFSEEAGNPTGRTTDYFPAR